MPFYFKYKTFIYLVKYLVVTSLTVLETYLKNKTFVLAKDFSKQ